MRVLKEILLSASLLAMASVVTEYAEPRLSVQIIAQRNAPLEIVSIVPSGDNLFASVTVRNTTDHYVQDFDVAWSLFRPANCAVNWQRSASPADSQVAPYEFLTVPGCTIFRFPAFP